MTTIEYDDEISHANGAHDTAPTEELVDESDDVAESLAQRLARVYREFDVRIAELRAKAKACTTEADELEVQRGGRVGREPHPSTKAGLEAIGAVRAEQKTKRLRRIRNQDPFHSDVLADEAAIRNAGHRTEYGMAKPKAKRVRKAPDARSALGRKLRTTSAVAVAATPKAKAKPKPAVRHGKSLPREGTMGNHVLKAMALDDFDGTARFITEQLGCKPAVVAGQLNNLLARGIVKDNGKERAERRWSRAT